MGIESDEYSCISILTSIDEEKYSGVWNPSQELPLRANYIMVDGKTGERFWFTSAYDAISFVNYQQGITRDLALMGYAQSTESEVEVYFNAYRGRIKNGFWWFTKEDEDIIAETMMRPKLIYCETRRLQFNDVDEAARWLCETGAATNFARAKQQLLKHLAGETASCYKLKFIEY